jgi:beta-glucosidase
VLPYHPKIIVYYCGSNDINANFPATDIVDRTREFIARVQRALPETRIFYVSINRAPQKRDRWGRVDSVNAMMKAHCARDIRLGFIDVNPALFDERGEPRMDRYRPDRLHLVPSTYQEFTKIIKPLLEETFMNGQPESLRPLYLDPSRTVEERVRDLLSRMTLEEKAGQWVHDAPAIERLGIPAYNWWSEGLHGVARAGFATVFPQAIGLAATWDPVLLQRIGGATSDEARAKHHDFLRKGERGIYQGLTFWSPNINLFRDPRWGRGMETFGEDPFLTGSCGVAFIRGLQGTDPRYLKLVGTMKHFAVHSGPEPDRHQFDAVVGERDLRESYLPHFRMCVEEANVQSVMCAYNRFLGSPCCGSTLLVQKILREEWGFSGYVTSDCGAIGDIFKGHRVAADAAEAAAMAIGAGTDLNCSFNDAAPLDAVQRGLLPEETLDRSIGRLFRARFQLGMFDPPEHVPYAAMPMSVVGSQKHRELALEAARKSIVLLKNEQGALPLRRTLKNVAVVGPNTDDVLSLLGNYYGTPDSPVTPLRGIRDFLGAAAVVTSAPGCEFAHGVPHLEGIGADHLFGRDPGGKTGGLRTEFFRGKVPEGTPAAVREMASVEFNWCAAQPIPPEGATHFTVRWTGLLVPPVSGVYQLGTFGFRSFRIVLEESVAVASEHGSEVPITRPVELVAGKEYRFMLEGTLRFSGSLGRLLWSIPGRDLVGEAVRLASAADQVILVLGLSPRLEGEEMPVEITGFAGGDRTAIELPEPQERLLRTIVGLNKPVTLVLLNGSALAIPWAHEHVRAILEAWYPGQEGGRAIAEVLFGACNPSGRLPVTFYPGTGELPPFADYRMEGRTYRFYRGKPLYPFGHGLSYTTFAYENFRASHPVDAAATGDDVRVSLQIRNTGTRSGEEVVQVYVRARDSRLARPASELRAFGRVSLEPGEARTVSFALPRRAFEHYDVERRRWEVEPGAYEVLAGASSADIRARLTVTLK